jgi:hypothetical protein
MPVKKKTRAVTRKAPAKVSQAAEGFVQLDGLEMYRIPDVDRMPPFLMSVVSDSDHWMFVSSTGGLTAGRVDEDQSLFPYTTDDELHLGAGVTGPVTLLRIGGAAGKPGTLWEPFTDPIKPQGVQRNLYKSVLGNIVVFEEIHPALGLTFRYRWANSEAFGFVRTSTLLRHDGKAPVKVEVLDGLLNLLPSGVGWFTTARFGCLMNAYMRNEVDPETSLGMFAMTATMSDRAEPSEALRTTVAWATGLPAMKVVLSAAACRSFREGRPVDAQPVVKGRRGAYMVNAKFTLAGGKAKRWHLAADVRLGHLEVGRLRAKLRDSVAIDQQIEESLAAGSENLFRSVAAADGLQVSADRKATAHHFANVLFNIMRGGVFLQNYDLPGADFAGFVRDRNHAVYAAHEEFLKGLPQTVNYQHLVRDVEARNDTDLLRLAYEYLPLTFSRRHGDPSRPWNRFAIHLKNPDGSRRLAYQGNWRDIFQNWEALCLSYPGFIESVIAKFVNASTMDGFNPYRLSQAGIDWETPEHNVPWTNLGYWGDHQIIYMLKFLEHSRRYHPGLLEQLIDRPVYAYANVPYRIKPYADILKDPRNTVLYDWDASKLVDERVKTMGSDGRLVLGADGRVYHVTLAEKMLVSALAKISNLVTDGGIWLNTQRPEWNDANNALVGNGISVVTLGYLRRFLAFSIDLLGKAASQRLEMSAEVIDWCEQVFHVLHRNRALLTQPTLRDDQRKMILDGLGAAFSEYRQKVYPNGFSGRRTYDLSRVVELFRISLDYVDHSLKANRRPDRLYHSYNLLDLSADGREAAVGRLYEMLEGQVSALSSGEISAEETLKVLQALRKSRMYRPDQDSFILYPDRQLPGFIEKNRVPAKAVKASPLMTGLIEAGDTRVIARDAMGQYRFNSDFHNAHDLRAALDAVAKDPRWSSLAAAGSAGVLEVFEQVFDHRSFTGRSGTMYGYEGLGCIYWHMVAKLLLAVQETTFRAAKEGQPAATVRKLAEAYYQVRTGLGFNKTAAGFGAFPTDPYSHTPGHAGAQQPGMTGQVKEEVITRMGEMGITVEGGQLVLNPLLLRPSEFTSERTEWSYLDVGGKMQTLALCPGMLAFTFCQVPILFEKVANNANMVITMADGSQVTEEGLRLDARTSAMIFERTGQVREVFACIPAATMILE